MTAQTEATPRRPRVRVVAWYCSPPGSPSRRRPTDAVLLVACLVGLLLLGLAAPGPTVVDEGLTTTLTGLPTAVGVVFAVGYAAAATWAVVLFLVALAGRGRRLLAGTMLLSALAAFGAAGLAGSLAGTGWDRSWSAMWSSSPPPVYLAVRVAVVAAVVAAASPHLSHPLRSVGRVLLGVLAVSAVFVGVAYPIGATAGWLIGLAAAAAVHLVFGSPGGRPTPARVTEGLADLGLADAVVRDRAPLFEGVSAYEAALADGRPVRVFVLGRDEWDAQVASSMWNAVTRRGTRLALGRSRQSQVEHTALLNLLAERAGVRTLPVVTAGRSVRGDVLLVVAAPTGSLAVRADRVTDAELADAWAQVTALHAAGMAHGRIDPGRLVLDDAGRVALADLTHASIGADPSAQHIDAAQLLVATALLGGTDRAVAVAIDSLGPERLADVLPYLQSAVLDPTTRRAIRDREWDLPGLRDAVVAATGVEAPPLERIRRVTVGALVRVALIALLTYWLITKLSGVDFASLWSELSSADWWWLGLALLMSPTAQLFFAFSTLGATTAALRYFPVLMLQYAVQFIALIVPSTAARIALDVRFYQSFGVAAGAAVSLGMIDSFSGFVVQIVLLIVILLSGLPGFTSPVLSSSSSSSTSSDTSSSPSVLALAVAIGLVSILVVLVVPALRRRFSGRIRQATTALREQMHNARGALEVLRHPGKLVEMLGGNLGGQLVQAVVLGVCLKAFGADASLSQLVLINTGVSLFAGLMPVPGGMGVAEAGYTAGLQAIGVPSSVAISTAIAFRLVTFYLPPVWGPMSMRWLRRHSYV